MRRIASMAQGYQICHCEERSDVAISQNPTGQQGSHRRNRNCLPEIATSAVGLLAMTRQGGAVVHQSTSAVACPLLGAQGTPLQIPSETIAVLTVACANRQYNAGRGMPLPYNFLRDLLLSLYTAAAFFSTAAAVFFRRDLRFRPFCDNIRGRY